MAEGSRMRWDTREPCASCPYRKDAKLEHWDPSHFIDTLFADADPLYGAMFGCHGTRKLPEGWSICAGWLLNQKKHGFPSIQLRLAAMRNDEVADAMNEVHDGGHEMYESVKEMCEANNIFNLRRSRGERTEVPTRPGASDARARSARKVSSKAGDGSKGGLGAAPGKAGRKPGGKDGGALSRRKKPGRKHR